MSENLDTQQSDQHDDQKAADGLLLGSGTIEVERRPGDNRPGKEKIAIAGGFYINGE